MFLKRWTVRGRRPGRAGLMAGAVLLLGLGLAAGLWLLQTRSYIETGDLPELERRGKLRVLLPDLSDASFLPRRGRPIDYEKELIREFCRQRGLKPVWITVASADALIPALETGRGDLIAANLTVTGPRKERIAFTVPVNHVREQLVTRADDKKLRRPADLKGRRITLRRSSSFWETMEALQGRVPGLVLEPAPESMNTLDILERVAEGAFDLTVADSNVVEAVLGYRDGLKVAFDISGERPVAWGLRKNAPRLRQALNAFLNERRLTLRPERLYLDDLDGIRKRKVLRVLTLNDPAHYFLWRGHVMGFEYDLVKRFADSQGLQLEIIVPPEPAQLLPWLKAGRGDLVAASITITDERKREGYAFSRPYNFVTETVVARTGDNRIEELADLSHKDIVVNRHSSYRRTLEAVRKSGIRVNILYAPPEFDTRRLIDAVAEGKYDYTVADSHILETELVWRTDVKPVLVLSEPRGHGWVVRQESKKLLRAIDEYIKRTYRGLFYNVVYRKYFSSARKIEKQQAFRLPQTRRISPYDDMIRKYAGKYGFDWRLVAAQIYQESRFDPRARSRAGARGLMQLMPRTARELGFDKLEDPEDSIHAGVKYLSRLRERFDAELPVKDRLWFALAAYNAGYGHVSDARRLARGKGWSSDRWFDNVERAMRLLSYPKYYTRARHGYVRGREPVKYVREIRSHFNTYVQAGL